jgi:hypothetical protein
MSAVVEHPICIEASEKPASLDDILGTIKIAYTVTACAGCGRMVMLTELTTPVVREPALA